MIKFWQATTYHKSSIKLPLSNKPSPSNKPPPPTSRGRKLISPPSLLSLPFPPLKLIFFTNEWYTHVSWVVEKKISEMKLKWGTVMIKFWQATTYRKSSIKLPSQIRPLPLTSPPPLLRGRKLISPPSLLSLPFPPLKLIFFTNEWYTVLINHDCKTSCGLIRDGLLYELEVRICFWSSAAWLPTSCTWAFPHCIQVFYGELIPSSSFLN